MARERKREKGEERELQIVRGAEAHKRSKQMKIHFIIVLHSEKGEFS